MKFMPKGSAGRCVRVVAISLSMAVAVAGCGGGGTVADNGPVFALDRAVTTDIEPVDPARTDVVPAPTLRLVLQDLLTEHSDLSVRAMRLASDAAPLAATLAELTANTDDLTRAIGLVYGPEGAEAFDQLWTNHIEFFNDYAAAIGAGDADAAAEVQVKLDHYENDFSSYVDTATSGEADFHDVLHVLHGHIGQLLDQLDAWASGDAAEAYALGRVAHDHMDVIALALATGISRQQPDAFPGDPASVSAAACAEAQLLGSALVSAHRDVADATASGDAAAVDAAGAALAAIEAEAGLVDVAAIDATGETDWRSVRAEARAAIAASDACASPVPADG
ncbi:MAG: hypothetical protein ACE367_06665 [Acidimicrobiales bacterium]